MADKAMYAETKENLVLAKGRIIGIGRDDYGHRRIVLYVRGTKDKNPAYISFALNTDLPLDVTINDTVDVEGHYMSFTTQSDSFKSIKRRPVQYFVADKITRSETELEKMFGVPGFAHESSYCRAYFKGKIRGIVPSEGTNWINAYIHIPGEPHIKHKNVALLQYTSRMRVHDIDVQTGDVACVACFVTSKKKTKDGKDLFFEDFIVEDWAVVVPAADREERKREDQEEKRRTVPLGTVKAEPAKNAGPKQKKEMPVAVGA